MLSWVVGMAGGRGKGVSMDGEFLKKHNCRLSSGLHLPAHIHISTHESSIGP